MPDSFTSDFDTWVSEIADEIAQAQALTVSLLPDNPVELSNHLSRAQAEYARMGYLLADAECHLVIARARETIAVRKEFDFLSGPERKNIVESRIKDVIRMRDNLQVVVSALKQKCFGAMNMRKVHNAETTE